ncbi:hypothetical protein MIR68_004575 [Amoeboaphelidium protococcarum]|nr:hypothetical protein MIR68_004575 [Amoeboaphelidium protococcarum]KAI3650505.1 hypothetical protein MP228_003986 [Amoeboaphelidium protococcarum]KAI3654858.1 hypothetical protein MP228_000238 [Amoeboaphelidium protococcarum]
MPKQVLELKDFLTALRRPDAKSIVIKTNKRNTKFKLRTSKKLLTMVLTDKEKVGKLKESLPANLVPTEI